MHATSIAHTPPTNHRVVLNGSTAAMSTTQRALNLSTQDIFPTLSNSAPIIQVNIATIWHALRAQGISDKFFGRGGCWSGFGTLGT
jgi:maleate isomerase